MSAMSSSSSPSFAGDKKHWWLSNRKTIERYIKDARSLLATQNPSDVSAALHHLDLALAVSPNHETAFELKARSLLFLGRFRDVADMLQDYIPSFKCNSECSSSSVSTTSSDGLSQQLSKDKVKLLSFSSDDHSGTVSSSSSSSCIDGGDQSFKCFSVSDIKKRFLVGGLSKNSEMEGQWRYDVLGQACSHLGLMEDALVLLQTAKRLATADFRRRSNSFSDDIIAKSPSPTLSDSSGEVARLLAHVKLLLRRRAAALAAHDAGLHAESVRHFTKLLEGSNGSRAGTVPSTFIADCYVHRARACRAAGRGLAESIADCNRALALDPSSIPALSTRADLFESGRCVPDCLGDLEHLKHLYASFLRDRRLPGRPAWARPTTTGHWPRYSDVPGALRAVSEKISELRGLSCCGVDHHALLGLRKGCSRAELERAHVLLTLRHRPEKAAGFVDRVGFADERDVDLVRDQAKMSARMLYRLLQKARAGVLGSIEAEAALSQRVSDRAEMELEEPVVGLGPPEYRTGNVDTVEAVAVEAVAVAAAVKVFQGVFCRDMAVVESVLSQAGFNRPIPVKYEALRC